jgi:hypothetical protein
MEQAFYTGVNVFVQSINVKKQGKYLIKAEMYNEVVQILKGTEGKHQPQLKFWAKKHVKLGKIGEQDILHSSKEKLPMVTFENFFEKTNECHTAVGYLGRDKTWHEVILDKKQNYMDTDYFFFSHSRLLFVVLLYRSKLKFFIELCDQCITRKLRSTHFNLN